MADSELMPKDPFERFGNYVYGPRFRGRKDQVKKLQDYCVSRNQHVHGVPLVGKTSLVYHSLIVNKDKLHSEKGYPVCPIFVKISDCLTAEDVFREIYKRTIAAIKPFIKEDQKQTFEALLSVVEDSEEDISSIVAFFEQGIPSLDVDVVIVLAKFDKIRDLFKKGAYFSKLSTIVEADNVHAVVISRRSIESIEMLATENNGSVFAGSFDALSSIEVKPFGDNAIEEIEDYWSFLSPYFENVGLKIDDDYRETANYYANSHPYRLDFYNKEYYENFKQSDKRPNLKYIRSLMGRQLESLLRIVKDEKLLPAMQQAILGPVYDLTRDNLDALIANGYVRTISPQEKEKLLGINAGLVYHDNEEDRDLACVAPTDYFTLEFRSKFYLKLDFWNEWKMTFKALRNIGIKFFEDNYGLGWEDKQHPVIIEMKALQEKDREKDITQSPLREYLTETLLGQLFTVHWNTFKPIFDKLGDSFLEKYDRVKMFRNHHAHVNSEFLTEEEREEANQVLNSVQEDINNWNNKEIANLPLLIKDRTVYSITNRNVSVQLPFVGTICYDIGLNTYYCGRIVFHPTFGQLNIGRHVRVFNVIDNSNNRTKNRFPFFATDKATERLD